MFGTLIELGIKRDHAAIGVLEFLVDASALLALPAQVLKADHQLAVLSAQLTRRFLGLIARQYITNRAQLLPTKQLRLAREHLHKLDDGALAGGRMNVKPVHEALCAPDANAHAGLRPVLPRQNSCQIGDALALVADFDLQNLWRRSAGERIFDQTTAAVVIGVARNLGDRRCDLGLF